MSYSQEEIERARVRQGVIQRRMGQGRLLRDGEVTMRIDPVLYHNAVQQNQRVYGVRDCWTEKEFTDDMLRRHPELRVRNVGKTRVRVGNAGSGKREAGSGKLTRFGRATFHKTYQTGTYGK